MRLRKIKFYLIQCLGFFFLTILFALVFLYSTSSVYDFPPSKPFSGNHWYNPYERCGDLTIRANFHAHGIAWGKLTNGHNTDEQMYKGYSNEGYDIAGISNYHSISNYAQDKTDLYVPVYEHGYNLFKFHCLAINSKQVSYLDFPLLQSTSQQQKIIERLKANGDMVAIAHPKLSGRSSEDMQKLVHYDFTEVLNYFRVSMEEYDEALSNGRLSWIISNDDTHDLRDEAAFKIWNIIYTDHRNVDTILSNMKKGMHYGIKSVDGRCTNFLKSCKIRNDSLIVEFETDVEHFDVHGGEAELMDYQKDRKHFVYKMKPNDDFIRIVAKNKYSWIFLNPIIRWDGKNLPLTSKVLPKTNYPKTIIVRTTLGFFLLEILGFAILLFKRKFTR